MKILVTGANGYIGSNVVTRLIGLGHKVIAVDLDNKHIHPDANFCKFDIFTDNECDWYKRTDCPDVCIHLAWKDGFVHNSTAHMSQLSSHFIFLKNLIDNGLQQLIVMGTMHEVGYYEGAVTENTDCRPLSLYGVSKNALRQALTVYTSDKPVIFQWLRGFYLYGKDSYGNSIFYKIKTAENRGEKFFPFTTGKNKYDFLYIDEFVNQVVQVAMQTSVKGIINICSGEPVSLGEAIEKYISDEGFAIKLDYGKYPERPYDSPCIYGDNTKIQLILKGNK